jgi:hypothetical protein
MSSQIRLRYGAGNLMFRLYFRAMTDATTKRAKSEGNVPFMFS